MNYYPILDRYVVDSTYIHSVDITKDHRILETYWIHRPFVKVYIVEDMKEYILRYMVFEPEINEEEMNVISTIESDLRKVLVLRDVSLSMDVRAKVLVDLVTAILDEYAIEPEDEFYSIVLYYLFRDFLGYGVIDPLINDALVEDISCDGYDLPIYVYHRKYGSVETNVSLAKNVLDSLVLRLSQSCGKHLSLANPMVDGSLPDGSRLQATFGTEVTPRGSSFTIRRFTIQPLTPIDLIDLGTIHEEIMAYLWLAVEVGLSGIVVGETASGKTTTLNAILMFLPPEAKVVSIEDTRELVLYHRNWIASVTRETGVTGKIEMYDLLKAALRQRPDYIVVGEVRGSEAQTLFQAMSTGHTCYSTLHAGDVNQMVYRLESEPLNVPRSMLQFLDFALVQTIWVKDGRRVRRTKEVNEIMEIDPSDKQLLVNQFAIWDSKGDVHVKATESKKLEKMAVMKGEDIDEIQYELARKREFLRLMVDKNIRDYRVVTKLIHSYYRNPEEAFERLREEDAATLYSEIVG